jgi:succinate-semialdehyde dehydrogenase / glutarate-semialdehyde dehydrogenase
VTDEATSIAPTVMSIEPTVIERLLGRAVLSDAPVTKVILAPFTGEPLYTLPLSGAPEVLRAAVGARRAQVDWANRSVRERCHIVLAFHDLVLQHRDTALDIVQLETGKARRDALEELLDVLVTARHYARDARRLLRPTRHRGVFPRAGTPSSARARRRTRAVELPAHPRGE